MPFQIVVHQAQRRIVVRHTGRYTLEEVHAAGAEIRALAETTGYRRLLVDLRSIEPQSNWTLPQLYELAAAAATLLRSRVYVATVYDPNHPAAHVFRFVEKAAEREQLLVRTFQSEPAAISWLAAIARGIDP